MHAPRQLAAALFAVVAASACTRRATCDDMLLQPSTIDAVWATRGVVLGPTATGCGSSPKHLHVLEQTTASPEQRGLELRDALGKAGWLSQWAGYEADGGYMLKLERSDERLFVNVHRVEGLGADFRPTLGLGLHMAYGALPVKGP